MSSSTTAPSLMARADQKFLGATASFYGRNDHPKALPTQRFDAINDGIARLLHGADVLHGALLEARSADLELRFDQRGEPGVLAGEREDMRQDEAERDEAHVADDSPGRGLEKSRRHPARIKSFVSNHARVVAKTRVELIAPDVDRVDAPGAARQKYVGEAAGRRADVQADEAARVEAKGFQGRFELETAARSPAVNRPCFDCGVKGYRIRRLGERGAVDANKAGGDRRLRASPAREKAARDEHEIGALAHFPHRSVTIRSREIYRARTGRVALLSQDGAKEKRPQDAGGNEETTMAHAKRAAEHHEHAAEHHESAAHHHREAAKHST